MNKVVVGIIGVVLLGGAFVLIQSFGEKDFSAGSKRRIPDLSFQDYEGKTVALADFVGTPLVVNSWAKWCPFCVDELPDFVTVQQEYEGEVVFIAIDRAEPISVAKGFTDGLGITNDLVFLLDPRDTFYREIGGFSMPETLFVDREGNVVFHKRGVMPIEEIRQRVEDIL